MVLCLLLTTLTAGRAAAAAEPIQLRVAAGLDGVTKPGRWTPVRIDITSASFSGRAVLIVEWGAASIRRQVEIVAGVPQHYEVHLQTMAVGAAALVRIVANEQELASVTAPIRTLRADERFTVCEAPTEAGATGECTARPPVAALPRSLRGYDAADRVVITDTDTLTVEQRTALARWRAFKALDETGSLSATDRPRSVMPALARKPKTSEAMRIGIGLYVLALLGGGLAVASGGFRATAALAMIAVIVGTGTAAALAAGRSGWPSSIVVHQASLVQQLAGASGSIVTMHGAIEFPANGHFAVQALVNDGAFAATDGWPLQALDESGYPGLAGTFGLGQRQPLTMFAVIDFAPLAVVRRGTTIVITNTSSDDLSECRVATDALVGTDGLLAAGASTSVELPDPVIGPVIACALAAPPVSFSAGTRDVRTTGRTLVAAYLPPTDETPR